MVKKLLVKVVLSVASMICPMFTRIHRNPPGHKNLVRDRPLIMRFTKLGMKIWFLALTGMTLTLNMY